MPMLVLKLTRYRFLYPFIPIANIFSLIVTTLSNFDLVALIFLQKLSSKWQNDLMTKKAALAEPGRKIG